MLKAAKQFYKSKSSLNISGPSGFCSPWEPSHELDMDSRNCWRVHFKNCVCLGSLVITVFMEKRKAEHDHSVDSSASWLANLALGVSVQKCAFHH